MTSKKKMKKVYSIIHIESVPYCPYHFINLNLDFHLICHNLHLPNILTKVNKTKLKTGLKSYFLILLSFFSKPPILLHSYITPPSSKNWQVSHGDWHRLQLSRWNPRSKVSSWKRRTNELSN